MHGSCDQQRAECRPDSGQCWKEVLIEINMACDPDHSAYRGWISGIHERIHPHWLVSPFDLEAATLASQLAASPDVCQAPLSTSRRCSISKAQRMPCSAWSFR